MNTDTIGKDQLIDANERCLSFLGEQCRKVFSDREFDTGIRYYFGQCHGLMIKTVLVHYRRWALTLIVLLVPILYNLLSNLISQSQNANGIYKMNINSLNPQTILYNIDPMMEKFFQASINGATLENTDQEISPTLNREIWGEIFLLLERTDLTSFLF